MAFRTVTFDKIRKRVGALLGSKIDDGDVQDILQPLIDGSVHYAYEEIKYWPRYLRVQPRTIERGYVDFTEDSFVVYGAETSEVNGLYVRNGTFSFLPRYSKYDDDAVEYSIVTTTVGGDTWEIQDSGGTAVYSYSGTASLTPPLSGWTGSDDAPLLEATEDIGQVIKVWSGEVFTNGSTCPLDFYTDANGIRVPRATGDVVWVAYKQELTDEYGDGQEGTVSDIPHEFSEYAIYDAAYQMQFAKRTSNPNQYPFAYRKVTDVLDQQKLQITEETGHRLIADRFKTMYGVDVSVRP